MNLFNRITKSALAVALISVSSFAGSYFTNDKGIVLNGYDVVSYHTEYNANQGKPKYAHKHDGETFWFSSKANKELFKANPGKYIPAYGGYCAWAVAEKNAKVPVNPETFKIVDGQLLFFFNGPFKGKNMNTIVPWNEDEKKLSQKAEKNWKNLM